MIESSKTLVKMDNRMLAAAVFCFLAMVAQAQTQVSFHSDKNGLAANVNDEWVETHFSYMTQGISELSLEPSYQRYCKRGRDCVSIEGHFTYQKDGISTECDFKPTVPLPADKTGVHQVVACTNDLYAGIYIKNWRWSQSREVFMAGEAHLPKDSLWVYFDLWEVDLEQKSSTLVKTLHVPLGWIPVAAPPGAQGRIVGGHRSGQP